MIAYYPLFKHLHMTLVLVSVLLFICCWCVALTSNNRLQPQWLKILPPINDTLLLLFGVQLAVTLQMSPSQQPWLMAKLSGLVLYIALGLMALKRPGRGQKLVAGVAALMVFGYMLGAAITKSPWSWLS